MSEFQTITISRATYVGAGGTSVATPAATYAFVTSDYQPPVAKRYIETDVVKNQNGKFKYVYDNGPGFKEWSPFKIHCEEAFLDITGAVSATQYSRLLTLWEHPGLLGIKAPEGIYSVHWSEDIETAFRVFPNKSSDPIERIVTVQFEEA